MTWYIVFRFGVPVKLYFGLLDCCLLDYAGWLILRFTYHFPLDQNDSIT